MTSPSNRATSVGTRRARKFALLSWWMLAAFVVWTLVFIFLSEPILRLLFGFAPSQPGETFYLEAWGPWIAVTLVWLAPVLAGLMFAALAARQGAGKLAWWALATHALLVLWLTVPNIIGRLATL